MEPSSWISKKLSFSKDVRSFVGLESRASARGRENQCVRENQADVVSKRNGSRGGCRRVVSRTATSHAGYTGVPRTANLARYSGFDTDRKQNARRCANGCAATTRCSAQGICCFARKTQDGTLRARVRSKRHHGLEPACISFCSEHAGGDRRTLKRPSRAAGPLPVSEGPKVHHYQYVTSCRQRESKRPFASQCATGDRGRRACAILVVSRKQPLYMSTLAAQVSVVCSG